LLVTRRNAMMFDEFLKALIRTNYEIGGRWLLSFFNSII
jgi:hypothetical protein